MRWETFKFYDLVSYIRDFTEYNQVRVFSCLFIVDLANMNIRI